MLVLVELTPEQAVAVANYRAPVGMINEVLDATRAGVVLNANAQRAARGALLAYCEWYSETRYSAGWLSGINEQLAGNDSAYDFLRRVARGYWTGHDDFVEED